MTYNKALNLGKRYLGIRGFQFADNESLVLLGYAAKMSKEKIYANLTDNVPLFSFCKFLYFLNKRSRHIPLAYITHEKEFYKNSFYVNKNVLIPRPETEILVEQALRIIHTRKIKSIADIGTGSGCVAVSCAKYSPPDIKFYATDISDKALKIAKINCQKYGLRNIELLLGDFLEPLKGQKIDMIISNPPYLSQKDISQNYDLIHEPKKALTDDKNGLTSYKKIFSQIRRYNLKPKYILLEIGYNQAKKIQDLAKKYLPGHEFSVKKDMCERNRVVILAC